MPTFEVMVEDVYDQTFEEIYHAYRHFYSQRFYEVEAEDEQEAITLAEEGEGTLLREEIEYGDTVESEFHDSGEPIGEDYVETNVTVVTPRTRPQRPSSWDTYYTPPPPREPDWEV